jgi:hypothetical protein
MTTPASPATPATPKVSEWSKVKGFFGHMFSWFKNDAANFESSAATTINLVKPLLNELLVLTAGSKEAGAVSAIVTKVGTALSNTSAMLSGAEAGSADHSVAGYLNDVVTDLPTLLTDADVKNSTHLAEIEGTVTTVVGEVQAILAAIPEGHTVPVVGAAPVAAA